MWGLKSLSSQYKWYLMTVQSQGHRDLKQPVTPTVKSREKRYMHAKFCLTYLLNSYTVKDPLPREWHRPWGVGVGLPSQWKESRQRSISMSMGHPDLNILQLLLMLHLLFEYSQRDNYESHDIYENLWENPNVLNIFRKLTFKVSWVISKKCINQFSIPRN